MTTCKTICIRFGYSAFICLYKTVGCRVIKTYFVSFQLSFNPQSLHLIKQQTSVKRKQT
jgi:hypothetical protein